VIEIRRYVTRAGKDVVGDWWAGLDADLRARMLRGLTAFLLGTSAIASFCARECPNCGSILDQDIATRCWARQCVLLLCGGDKRKQASDITRAIEFLHDYKERTRKP
jgi:hypothetical protein